MEKEEKGKKRKAKAKAEGNNGHGYGADLQRTIRYHCHTNAKQPKNTVFSRRFLPVGQCATLGPWSTFPTLFLRQYSTVFYVFEFAKIEQHSVQSSTNRVE